ncbi:MAG: glycerophosphodiester phosphodiesterase [Pseudolabrys sp.]|nr:glycerophosphodiester phosphodiesterase [Pseudolabrys sp.]
MSLDWLTARPIAHRGLHDAANGVIENTASAFSAAIAGNYAIECDVQISADGEAMVHHDDALGRLTQGSAALATLTAAEIKAAPFNATADRIMTLGELCDLVASRVTLVIEIKSRFDGDLRLANRVAQVLASYRGPVSAMSFDPAPMEKLRRLAPNLTRGIVAERHYDHHEWDRLTPGQKWRLAFLTHAGETHPQFVAYGVRDLPGIAPGLAKLFRVPVLTWTVRSAQDRERAARYADQMIFEGFRP